MVLEVQLCQYLILHIVVTLCCQLSMVFKVIRKYLSLSYWKEIKTDRDFRKKRLAVRVYYRAISSRSSRFLPPSPLFALLKIGSCTANASPPPINQEARIPRI